MTKAIRFHRTGAADVLQYEDVDLKRPGRGAVRIRHTAIGVNFDDILFREQAESNVLPAIPGTEAVGVIEEIGDGIDGFEIGQRVAYATGTPGSYCERRNVHHSALVNVPDEIEDHIAAAALAKGMAAHYMVFRAFRLHKKHTILVQAAAGGLGHLLCQYAKFIGATVIGTVGSAEKAVIAKQAGCDHVINYAEENVVERIVEITDGLGVNVVYDGVGKDTFDMSLACLTVLGLFVSIGEVSGPIPPFAMDRLAERCLFMTRPRLDLYKGLRMELVLSAYEVFKMLEQGNLNVYIGQTYPLANAAQAHKDLTEAKTTGATILTL